jgi:2-C-methyl-D-erythritol 2,4-cyclodiphosphate synthase
LAENGFYTVNIDATLVMQRPKISPYVEEMISNVSRALEIPIGAVNIKATTEEKLGFTGNGEGAAAHAVALISK